MLLKLNYNNKLSCKILISIFRRKLDFVIFLEKDLVKFYLNTIIRLSLSNL